MTPIIIADEDGVIFRNEQAQRRRDLQRLSPLKALRKAELQALTKLKNGASLIVSFPKRFKAGKVAVFKTEEGYAFAFLNVFDHGIAVSEHEFNEHFCQAFFDVFWQIVSESGVSTGSIFESAVKRAVLSKGSLSLSSFARIADLTLRFLLFSDCLTVEGDPLDYFCSQATIFAFGEIADALTLDAGADSTGRLILSVDESGVEFFLDGCGVFKTSHANGDITAVKPYEFYKHEALSAAFLAASAELNKRVNVSNNLYSHHKTVTFV